MRLSCLLTTLAFLLSALPACRVGTILAYDPWIDEKPKKKESPKHSLVVIRTFDRSKNITGQGMGFFLDTSGTCISNHHLFEGAYHAEAVTEKGAVFSIDAVTAQAPDADLIRLNVAMPGSMIHPLRLKKELPLPGEDIMIIIGKDMVSDGSVASIRDIPKFGSILTVTASLSATGSGSPVVTLNNEVIGIATVLKIGRRQSVFVVPSSFILSLSPTQSVPVFQWQLRHSATVLQSAKDFYRRGMFHIWGESWKTAIELFTQTIKTQPNFFKAYSQMAYCYFQLDRPGDAAAVYRQLSTQVPASATIQYNLALALSENNQNREALEALNQAVTYKPDFYQAFTRMGWIYYQLEHYNDAVTVLDKAIEIKPDYSDAHMVLGLAYLRLGKGEWARNTLRQAVNIDPENKNAYINLASAYKTTGEYVKQTETLEKALTLDPADTEVMQELGSVYATQLTQYDKAREVYRRILAIHPNDTDALFGWGKTELDAGNIEAARKVYKKLTKIDESKANMLDWEIRRISRSQKKK